MKRNLFLGVTMILLEGMHHVSLGSADLERSIKFYRDIFDFELIEQSDQHVFLRLDPFHIRFNYIVNYHCSIKNPGETSYAFILDIDDFTDAIRDLEKNEIEIIKGPLSIEGGESLLVSDPDGHLLELFYQE